MGVTFAVLRTLGKIDLLIKGALGNNEIDLLSLFLNSFKIAD